MTTQYSHVTGHVTEISEDFQAKDPETRPEGKKAGRVYCVHCQEAVPARTHNILADLCNRCVALADVAARDLVQAEQVFSATFHRSPSFVREFADWVLRTSLPEKQR